MKDGNGTGTRTEDQVEVSRHQLYDRYVNWYLRVCPEVRPCRDSGLLKEAAQYLLRDPEPEPGGPFTVFPVYEAVRHRWSSLTSDCCKHLAAVIRATEQLETICVNLFLQPWRREIRTLKTFTGPFVYCLLPVLSSSTIQSVLASIGYLPHSEAPQSEYRLSEEATPDRAMLLGFELLLARVQCSHLLELLEKDQLGPQELLEVLQRKVMPTNLEEPTEKKTTTGPKEEEKKKTEEADRKKVPLYLDTRLAVKPKPKPRSRHPIGVDQSIVEMQMTYPDLAFRGRPLLRDKPQRADSRKSSGADVHPSSSNNPSDGGKAAEIPNRESIKGTKAAAASIRSKNDGSQADEVFGDGGGDSGCHDAAPGDTSSTRDGSRADDELSGPPAISLHLTLRAGSTAEPSPNPGEPQPTAEPRTCTQQHTSTDLQNNGAPKPKLPSLSSMDEEQELRELAERMGQIHVQESKEEVQRKDENKRKEENTKKEKRKKERKTSSVGEAEELKLREKPAMQAGPARSHTVSRSTRSSQGDPAALGESQRSPPAVGKGGENTDGRGDEEQLANSFVLVEHHKK